MTAIESALIDEPPARSAAVAQRQVAEQLRYLAGWLPPPPARVLDAGCGGGGLTLALTGAGYAVTAIDSDPKAVAAARGRGVPAVEADIASFEAEPFEAVLFSLSLHHVDSLEETVARARALVGSTGVLVLDEFAWERADTQTAVWFYDTAALLGSAGLLYLPDAGVGHAVEPLPEHGPAGEHDGSDGPDGPGWPGADGNAAVVPLPLEHWVRRHHQVARMHPGEQMVAAVARAFEVRDIVRSPYLHRYLGSWLADLGVAVPIYRTLREVEARRVFDGHLRPVGFRLLAGHAG
ncbi:MAG TPA: class I SAM-dependent methyltransferase [Pilimelia sp.]|nr:class I SAM-dependent methyltransferase [Pilimelia sp.]